MNPSRRILTLGMLTFAAALSGCGTKTDLVRPPGPPTPPILGAASVAQPAPRAAALRDDGNKSAVTAS